MFQRFVVKFDFGSETARLRRQGRWLFTHRDTNWLEHLQTNFISILFSKERRISFLRNRGQTCRQTGEILSSRCIGNRLNSKRKRNSFLHSQNYKQMYTNTIHLFDFEYIIIGNIPDLYYNVGGVQSNSINIIKLPHSKFMISEYQSSWLRF